MLLIELARGAFILKLISMKGNSETWHNQYAANMDVGDVEEFPIIQKHP